MAQIAAAFAGEALRRRVRPPSDDERESFKLVQGSALTLIALLIGFTLSMAVGRYDQRHNLEEEEANAIGTEYLRVDFLPAADAAKIKELLRQYLDARIQFFSRRGPANAAENDSETVALAGRLVERRPGSRRRAAVAADRSFRLRHERRVECARLYAGRVLESDSDRGLGADGRGRAHLQRHAGLRPVAHARFLDVDRAPDALDDRSS